MFLIFDTETTGLSTSKDHIVQLGWIIANEKLEAIKEYSYIVKPSGYTIPKAASAIHKISTEQAVKEGRNLEDVLQKFQNSLNSVQIAVAHNISFDSGILREAYIRIGRNSPIDRFPSICTMKLSTNWCRLPKFNGGHGFKYPKLEELYFILHGTNFPNAHDALEDCKATLACLKSLVHKEIIVIPKTKFAARLDFEKQGLVHPTFQSVQAEPKPSEVSDIAITYKSRCRHCSEVICIRIPQHTSQVHCPNCGVKETVKSEVKEKEGAVSKLKEWKSPCKRCHLKFSVTLNGDEDHAICPHCYHANKLDSGVRQDSDIAQLFVRNSTVNKKVSTSEIAKSKIKKCSKCKVRYEVKQNAISSEVNCPSCSQNFYTALRDKYKKTVAAQRIGIVLDSDKPTLDSQVRNFAVDAKLKSHANEHNGAKKIELENDERFKNGSSSAFTIPQKDLSNTQRVAEKNQFARCSNCGKLKLNQSTCTYCFASAENHRKKSESSRVFQSYSSTPPDLKHSKKQNNLSTAKHLGRHKSLEERLGKTSKIEISSKYAVPNILWKCTFCSFENTSADSYVKKCDYCKRSNLGA